MSRGVKSFEKCHKNKHSTISYTAPAIPSSHKYRILEFLIAIRRNRGIQIAMACTLFSFGD
jgi:hypothetical protein